MPLGFASDFFYLLLLQSGFFHLHYGDVELISAM